MKISKGLRFPLIIYDLVFILFLYVLFFVIYRHGDNLDEHSLVIYGVFVVIACLGGRLCGGIYHQIWRYGGIQCYIRLLAVDFCIWMFVAIIDFVVAYHSSASVFKMLSFSCCATLCSLAIRMIYRFAYKYGGKSNTLGYIMRKMLALSTGNTIEPEMDPATGKIKIAIIGAGALGVALAEELRHNPFVEYVPMYFLDIKTNKIGRVIHGLQVLDENSADSFDEMREAGIMMVVLTVSNLDIDRRKSLYSYYNKKGFKLKVYDYPVLHSNSNKRVLREFDVEELLFRKPVYVMDDTTSQYYRGKTILVTGGGGSIGSELCRQIARLKPKQLVVLDVYENGAYDLQQELRIKYGDLLNLQLEILSITNKVSMAKVFQEYKPQIVIHAAAHKHVPLMEHNSIEAVENNVFGTLNVVQLCEEFGVERFMMVSTDKAVNPTNVMGATKRMCEMIVQCYSTFGRVKYSSTRFGNVLGSAGSVIPLFKKQIASGGPITITDKRIIRYFMTIPEASQLVLTSGAMANNGELFVLDMGEPVKIIDLAENMIKISGMPGIEIKEIGLRPGEKLYEELLIDGDNLIKTANNKIFIEHDTSLERSLLEEKLLLLHKAVNTTDSAAVVEALQKCVPTFVRK